MPSSVTTRARKSSLSEDGGDPIHRMLCGRVRELRKKKGWTLEQLSAACGVSRSMLSEIERGNANPTLAVAFRIAGAFSMSLGDLVDAPAAPSRIDVMLSLGNDQVQIKSMGSAGGQPISQSAGVTAAHDALAGVARKAFPELKVPGK